MKNTQSKDKDNNKESTRKPLPQSSIVGKRKEIFNLNTIKEKKSGDTFLPISIIKFITLFTSFTK